MDRPYSIANGGRGSLKYTTLLLIHLFSPNNQVLEIVLMLHITYGLVPIDPRSYYYKDSVPFINFKIASK